MTYDDYSARQRLTDQRLAAAEQKNRAELIERVIQAKRQLPARQGTSEAVFRALGVQSLVASAEDLVERCIELGIFLDDPVPAEVLRIGNADYVYDVPDTRLKHLHESLARAKPVNPVTRIPASVTATEILTQIAPALAGLDRETALRSIRRRCWYLQLPLAPRTLGPRPLAWLPVEQLAKSDFQVEDPDLLEVIRQVVNQSSTAFRRDLVSAAPVVNQAVLDAVAQSSTGKAVMTIQRWFRGHRTRRLLSFGFNGPQPATQRSWRPNGTPLNNISALLETVPEKRFLGAALTAAPEQLEETLGQVVTAWISYIDNVLSKNEREQFYAKAPPLFLERIEGFRRIRVLELESENRVNGYISGGALLALPISASLNAAGSLMVGVGSLTRGIGQTAANISMFWMAPVAIPAFVTGGLVTLGGEMSMIVADSIQTATSSTTQSLAELQNSHGPLALRARIVSELVRDARALRGDG
jgi:hypothetical protein